MGPKCNYEVTHKTNRTKHHNCFHIYQMFQCQDCNNNKYVHMGKSFCVQIVIIGELKKVTHLKYVHIGEQI